MEVRTTFANGVNPFTMALEHMPKRMRRVEDRPKPTKDQVLALLADGHRRTVHEVIDAVGGTPNELGYMLATMARAGFLMRAMRPCYGSGVKPVPEFWRLA
jgi:hypothetical protein